MPTPPSLFRLISGNLVRAKLGNDDPARDVCWVPRERGSVVVEVGTGGGYYTDALDNRLGPDVTYATLDLSHRHVLDVTARTRKAGGTVLGIAGDGTNLPFADASVDCLFYSYSFEEIPDTAGALDEIARVVRPGGCVVLFLWRPVARRPKRKLIEERMTRSFDLGPSSVGPQNLRQIWVRHSPAPAEVVDASETATPGRTKRSVVIPLPRWRAGTVPPSSSGPTRRRR